jgi:hypothetical protein
MLRELVFPHEALIALFAVVVVLLSVQAEVLVIGPASVQNLATGLTVEALAWETVNGGRAIVLAFLVLVQFCLRSEPFEALSAVIQEFPRIVVR